MTDISIRKTGCAGRITLQRPKALNALTYDMALAIEAALDRWAGDDDIACVVIDAEGEKAFCAGGDLAAMYETGTKGDYEFGRKFWRDEYRLNAKVFDFPKPYIAFCQGFTMGGGVGIALHGSHRIVGNSSRISMPECSVGLVPDVGGSLLLARAPGRLGEYLGTTGQRMDGGDAIYAGFADYHIEEEAWPALIEEVEATGDWEAIDKAAQPVPPSRLSALQPDIDAAFGGAGAGDVLRGLGSDEWAEKTKAAIAGNSPLSVVLTLELVRRVRGFESIRPALEMEYRITSRSASEGDFLEGIRAMIIDKDRQPAWKHASVDDVSHLEMVNMLMPLKENGLWEDAA